MGAQTHDHAHEEEGPHPAPEPQALRAGGGRGNSFRQDQLRAGQSSGPDAAPATGTGTGSSAEGDLVKLPNPEPVKKGEQRVVCLGVTILGRDVSPTSIQACERFVKATLANRKDIQERMKSANVTLVIIPRDKKMTDLTEFASLKGTKTFDGRLWDNVRGSGGMSAAGGVWAIAVPEENLVQVTPDNDGYGAGYNVGLHELSHTIHSKGVTDKERKTIEELYAARKKAGGPWTETYGSSNSHEYYAQATNCFFGANKGIGQNGAAWLEANDKPMYDFLCTIYGTPPAKKAG